ncbi:MAG: asparaginase [Jatrophihabitantaceae bacterium]
MTPVTRSISAYFLGGTISMSGHGGGAVVRLGADELLAAVPQLADLDARVDALQFRSLPSAALSFDDIVELVATAEKLDGVDGVVVVQGTDTLEETAYLIDLLWTADTPVVLTGAMRNPSLAGPDGPANLLAAVTVAASDRFRGQGALVVFSDEVHAARFVRKTHSTSTATFASPNAGPIGHVIEGSAVALTRVERLDTHRVDGAVTARVPVLSVGLDDGGELLDALADRCDGLVVAALGAGHVPPRLAEPLGALARRVPVVLTTRTGAGAVLSHTYGYPGSETDLLARGLIGGGLLDAYKARVLLRVLLSCGHDRSAIAAAFARAGSLLAEVGTHAADVQRE